MSTHATTSNFHNQAVVIGVAENAFFSAFCNLVLQRKGEGVSKVLIANRMGVDKAAVTKYTTVPTNMKISTIASFADALDADLIFLLVDRKDRRRIFSPVGVHNLYAQNMIVSEGLYGHNPFPHSNKISQLIEPL